MKNCLIEKLKGESNNPNLPLYNYRLLVNDAHTASNAVRYAIVDLYDGTKPVFVSSNGNSYSMNNGTETNLDNVNKTLVNEAPGYFIVTPLTLGALYINNLQFDGAAMPEVVCASPYIKEVWCANNVDTIVLSDFGAAISLEVLSTYVSTVSGSLESLAEAQVAAGRVSGTLRVTGNGIITYNGTPIANNNNKIITFNNGSYVIS